MSKSEEKGAYVDRKKVEVWESPSRQGQDTSRGGALAGPAAVPRAVCGQRATLRVLPFSILCVHAGAIVSEGELRLLPREQAYSKVRRQRRTACDAALLSPKHAGIGSAKKLPPASQGPSITRAKPNM